MNSKFNQLRQKAENLLKEKGIKKPENYYDDVDKLVEELNIHQIELEMQNMELQESNKKLVAEQNRYKELYLNAPIAYFTLNKTGNIVELNHAAADMLKIPIQAFRYTSIFPYLEENSKNNFTKYFKQVFDSGKIEYGEIIFKNSNNDLIYTNLSAINYFDEMVGEILVRCSIVDISKIKHFQSLAEKLDTANEELNVINDKLKSTNLLVENERQQFLSILDNIPEAIYVADIYSFKILFANKYLKKTFGKDITGELCYNVIQCKTEACDFCTSKHIKNTNEPYFWEYYNHVLNKHFYVMDRKITWTDQKDVHFELAIDITEHKIAEEALIKSEEKYRLITENASDVIWILNITQQKFTYISPSVYALRGYTPEEAMNQDINQSLTPESAKEVVEDIGEILPQFLANPQEMSKKIHRHELRQPCKDGSIIWIETTTRYQLNTENEVEVIGISRNIDERKKYEERINLNNSRLNDLLELSQQATNNKHQIFDYALNTAVKVTKSQYGYIYFYSEGSQQFVLNTWSNGVMPECEVMNQQTIYDLSKTGIWGEVVRQRKTIIVNDFGAENPLKKGYPHGHIQIKSFLSIPFFQNNQIVAVVGVANKAENYDNEDVIQLNLLMETVWNIYIKKEAEAKIRQLVEELKIANSTKDKFFSIIAHDLKNPFNSLLGFSELLIRNAQKFTPEKVQHFAQTMNNSARQAFKLLENLLEWARLQTGNIKLNPTNFSPSEIVAEVVSLNYQMAKAKNIVLQTVINCDACITADKEMLKTVLRNLLTNALKFTHAEGNVKIETQYFENQILFAVSDTGLGIEPEHIGKLFKIEKKKKKTGTANETGTGLGLILCKEFVEKHGGKIWVESEVGRGSEFKFTIPIN